MKAINVFILVLCLFSALLNAQVIGEDNSTEVELGFGSEEVPTNENTIWQFKENGKIGFKVDKKIVVKPIYEEVQSLGKEAFIVKKNGLYGTINTVNFKTIIPIKYEKLEKKYFGNYLLITKNGKQGTLSYKGKKVLSIKYNEVIYCNPELKMSLVKDSEGKIFFIYKNEKTLKTALNKVIVYKNIIIAEVDGKYGFLGKNGIIKPFEYDAILGKNLKTQKKNITLNKSNYPIQLLVIKKENKQGLINSQGKEVLPTIYDNITYDSGRSIYKLIKEKKKGIYFITSKTVLPAIYDTTYTDGTRFVILTKDQKKGAINYNGEFVLPMVFDNINIHGFSTSFKVTKDKKVGWYDNTGKVIIPLLYDEMDDFYESGFSNFYKVRIGENKGVIDKKGKVIVPVAFEYVFAKSKFFQVMKNNKSGLYSLDGEQLQPLQFDVIKETITQNTNILLAKNNKGSLILNKNTGEPLFNNYFNTVSYAYNPDKLINPHTENGKTFLILSDANNMFGVLDEKTLTLNIPNVYDAIAQKFEADTTTYFIAKKGKKYGVIDHQNNIIIPFDFQFIEFSFMSAYLPESINFVAQKNNKFGVIDFKNNTLVPFKYNTLAKINNSNLFKGKKGNHYALINAKNEILNPGPFDEISNFETNEAQAFYNGKMRVIDRKGNFLVPAVSMEPHNGFETFDALKNELVSALNNKNDSALKVFASKIAPSKHLLRYVTKNIFNDQKLGFTDTNFAIERYFKMLLEFKYSYWKNDEFYNKKRLTEIDEYTSYKTYYGHSIVTNTRSSDPAYGSRNLEHLLRRSIKINGFWISSFFMDRRFYKR